MKNIKGFTLIELLIVIAIIGILASASFTLINPSIQFKRANDAKRKADIGRIQAALELFRADKGSYPSSTTVTPVAFPACNNALTDGIAAPNTTTYLTSIPCDPKNASPYTYTYSAAGSNPSAYTLTACLEAVNTGDTSPCPAGAVYTVTNP